MPPLPKTLPPLLVISKDVAISEPTLIWLEPLKMMPLGLISRTVPSALMWPSIWLGTPVASMRFSATQLAWPCWSKTSVVFGPILKYSQVITA